MLLVMFPLLLVKVVTVVGYS